jgi:hypothetical protein
MVIEDVIFDEDEDLLVAHVRPRKGIRQWCGWCGRCGTWEDRGDGHRRWRSDPPDRESAKLRKENERLRAELDRVQAHRLPEENSPRCWVSSPPTARRPGARRHDGRDRGGGGRARAADLGAGAACRATGQSQADHSRRHRQSPPPQPKHNRTRKPQPRALSQAERAQVGAVLNSADFADAVPAPVYHTLLDEGT